AVLQEELAELTAAWRYLADHPNEAPGHARRLMDWMADVLQTALLLEQAVAELKEGQSRTLLVAQWLARGRLRPPARRGVEQASMAFLERIRREFEAIIGHGQGRGTNSAPASLAGT